MTVLVEARAVEVWFPGQERPAVAGVDLAVRKGEAIGVVGESGSGKTTLARTLVGALEPTHGEVVVSGRAWSGIARRDPLRRSVQMVFQDPYGSLNPWLTPRETVSEVIRVWESIGRREANRRTDELLREVGLPPDAMDRRPGQLSGGQCQRVGIARALACDPQVLVADEPTSSLDVSVQAQILNLLLQLRESRHLTLVLISHDLAVVRFATDEALVMYGGTVVERGDTDRLLSAPLHPYTRVLVDSLPGQEGPARPVENQILDATGCVFAARCAYVEPNCLTKQPEPVENDDRLVACIHPLLPAEVKPNGGAG